MRRTYPDVNQRLRKEFDVIAATLGIQGSEKTDRNLASLVAHLRQVASYPLFWLKAYP